jgi:hypothetical protein
MNKIAVAKEILKVAKSLIAREVDLWVYDAETDKKLGKVTLYDYEARHFLNSRSFAAKIALNDQQIKELGIDDRDLIYFDKA